MHNKVYITKKTIWLYILVFILLMSMSAANILNSRYVMFFIGLLLVGKAAVDQSIRFNRSFFVVLFIWILINTLAMVYFSVFYNLARLLINTVNLFVLPYLLFIIYGVRVWFVLERIVYFLTRIALVLYILNLTFPEFFNNLQDFFAPITTETLSGNPNYWSAFIYVNAFSDNGYGIVRNNGFMWEPGGFAMMIIWAVIFNQLNNNYDKKRFIIYFVTLLTTFSTAGYIAIALILLSRRVKRLNLTNIFIIIVLSTAFYYSYTQLEFLSGKVETYTEEFRDIELEGNKENTIKVNRFQGGVTALNRTLEYPIGYGLISAEDLNRVEFYGVNGLGSLMEMWGIPMFFFIVFQIFKYIKEVNVDSNKLTRWFLFIALMVLLFSNPISRFLLVYMIILTPITKIFRNYNYELSRNEK